MAGLLPRCMPIFHQEDTPLVTSEFSESSRSLEMTLCPKQEKGSSLTELTPLEMASTLTGHNQLLIAIVFFKKNNFNILDVYNFPQKSNQF